MDQTSLSHFKQTEPWALAIIEGNLDKLRELGMEHSKNPYMYVDPSLYTYAASYNNLEILIYLREGTSEGFRKKLEWSEDLCCMAIMNKNLKMLEYIIDNDPRYPQYVNCIRTVPKNFGIESFKAAIKRNSKTIIKYLIEKKFMWNEEVSAYAAQCGKLEILKLLRKPSQTEGDEILIQIIMIQMLMMLMRRYVHGIQECMRPP
jgi:hypothetical protein